MSEQQIACAPRFLVRISHIYSHTHTRTYTYTRATCALKELFFYPAFFVRCSSCPAKEIPFSTVRPITLIPLLLPRCVPSFSPSNINLNQISLISRVPSGTFAKLYAQGDSAARICAQNYFYSELFCGK